MTWLMKLLMQLKTTTKRLLKMKMNWSELDKGTKLYVLVPNIDANDCIQYTYQESKIICIKPYINRKGKIAFVNVRFKYTDQDGKRKRINCQVSNIDNSLAEYPHNGPQFGKIIFSHESKDKLRGMYIEMISKEIDKINNQIAKLKEQSIKLERTKYEDF